MWNMLPLARGRGFPFSRKPISVGMDGLPELLADVRSRDFSTYVAYPFSIIR